MIVDFHNHYYPPAFLDAVRAGPSAFRVTEDADGNPVLHSPGDYNVIVPGHRDLDARIRDMDEAGVDAHVITFTAPGTSIETPDRAAALATIVNDGLVAAREAHPGRLHPLGHLPLTNPDAAVAELDRVLGELDMPGVMLFSNAGGVPLANARFDPLWERLDEAASVVYIHPTYPVGVEAMEDYMLMPLVGFLMDTTLAAAHLVFAGVAERHPNIRWVLCHTGGAVPFLAERFDRGFEAFERCRENLTRKPSDYLREFHYDTVNFDLRCLRLAVDFAGVDHVVAGSDYPHMIGSMTKMRTALDGLGLSAEEKGKISSGNARGLLGI